MVPGALTPRLHEGLVRLSTWLPFAPAARLLAHFTGTAVSAATARRQTERAGARWVQMQDAEGQRLAREMPVAAPGPAVQQISVDGAMVPLRSGEWGEVKLLTIGTVEPAPRGPRAVALSYFGRRADHETFARLALVETHRRGTETAGIVVGVTDGADWCQAFLDAHRPDAIRILDFAHAVGYLHAAAQATFGTAGEAASVWVSRQAHELKAGAPEPVLAALRDLPTDAATDVAAARTAQTTALGYLGKRLAQIRYAAFRDAGYPIGSGMVESANKLVTEARLKGAGMRWAPASVNPMVALRTVECADRWAEVWPQLEPALRAAPRRRKRSAAAASPRHAPPPRPSPPSPPARAKLNVAGRPTCHHPWKRLPCLPGGRAYRDAHPEL